MFYITSYALLTLSDNKLLHYKLSKLQKIKLFTLQIFMVTAQLTWRELFFRS